MFGRKKKPPKAVTMTVPANDAALLAAYPWRKGMWVAHDGHVAILVRALPPGSLQELITLATVQKKKLVMSDEAKRVSQSEKINETVAGLAELHYVGRSGETVAVVAAPLSQIDRQAKWKEIPESRRPDKGLAVAMGYVA